MNTICGEVADHILSRLEKDELVEMSLVSKYWRQAVFNCLSSQMYVKAPVHDISRLATSFSVVRKKDWDHICRLHLVVHRLRLDHYGLSTLLLNECEGLMEVDGLAGCA